MFIKIIIFLTLISLSFSTTKHLEKGERDYYDKHDTDQIITTNGCEVNDNGGNTFLILSGNKVSIRALTKDCIYSLTPKKEMNTLGYLLFENAILHRLHH